MKKITCLFIATSLFTSVSTFGQLNKINFLGGGLNDAQTLFKAYLDPWAKSIGTGLDAGWYNTAKPHGLLGFDVTLTTSFAMVPSGDKAFTWNQSDYQSLELKDQTKTEVQTIAGSDKSSDIYIDKNHKNLGSFNLPGGVGLAGVPLPIIKVGVGLPFSTEIDARFLPKLSLGDYGKVNMWGVALKHSVKQWIPIIGKVPFWDMSLFGSYSHFGAGAEDLNYTPATLFNEGTYSYTGKKSFDGQSVDFTVNTWDVSLLVSTCLPIINVYGGVGYTSSLANLALKGNYYTGGGTVNSTTQKIEISDDDIQTDPVDMDFDRFSNFKVNAGVRLKLALLTIHADYTYANYSIYSMGLGISFR
jgi:hypothetical protein